MVILLCWWVFTTTIQAIKSSDKDYNVNERFVKLSLSGKNKKQWAWQNMGTFHAYGVMLLKEIWRETGYKLKKNLNILSKDRYM